MATKTKGADALEAALAQDTDDPGEAPSRTDLQPTNLGAPIDLPEIMKERELIVPDDTELGTWREFGQYLQGLDDKSKWWIGDWLRRGEELFQEDYAQGLDGGVTGLSLKTLNNYRRVAEAFEPKDRKWGLTWSHYRAVAADWITTRQRNGWLKKAEAEGWSVQALEDVVAEKKATMDDGDKPVKEVQEKTHRTFTLSFTVPLGLVEDGVKLHEELVAFRDERIEVLFPEEQRPSASERVT